MSTGSRSIPEALLECYLVGELDAEARAQVEAVLAESEGARARLAELRAESAAFLVQRPPGPLVARFESSQRRWWRKPLMLLMPVLAVAAAVTLVALVPDDDPFTTKGGVVLVLHRKRGESSATVAAGETLLPGDALRFEVRASASKGGYVAVLSRDAAGGVTMYYPYGQKDAAPYDPKVPLLPGAIELAEGGGEEVVYALVSREPFVVDWAVSALREGRDLASDVPPEIAVGRTSFVVRKSR